MRTKLGENIFVLDGRGNCYEVTLTKYGKDFVEGNIISKQKNFHESKRDLTLAVGLLKNPSKFDFVVEKTTELGVKNIIPMISEHSIAKSIKIERMQKLALAAMKQCGRGFLPIISEVKTFEEIIATKENYDKKFVAYEHESKHKKSETENWQSAIVVVGNEGGFSEKEILQAKENYFMTISLGERRLRTETAAIVVCSTFLR